MISLVRTQLIVLLSLNILRSRKKRLKLFFPVIVFILAMSPTYIGFIVFFNKAYRFASTYQLPPDIMLAGVYSIGQMLVIFLGVPVVFSTLLRSKDLSILLPLPYTPLQLVASKMIVSYVIELGISALFIVPVFVLNTIYTDPGLVQVLNGILSIILLPVIPLCICAILTVLVSNVPGIGRSKWFWHIGIVVSVMALAMSMSSFSFSTIPNASEMMRDRLQQTSRISQMIPGSMFGVRTMVSPGFEGIINQLLNIAVAGAYTAAMLLVSAHLYIRPILQGEGIRRSKRRRRVEPLRSRSFVFSYIRKEFAATLKDPAVAMNGMGGYVSIPILVITYTLMKIQTKGQVDVIGMLVKFANDSRVPQFMPMLIVIVALSLAFFGGSSTLFSTTYSKDGKRLWIEKSLPVDLFTVFVSKMLAAVAIITVLNAITTLVLAWIFPLGFWPFFYAFIVSEIIITSSGIIGMIIDCRRPKVEWKDTVQAVKNNMNALIAFAGMMLLMVLNGLMLYGCSKYHVPASWIYISILAVNVILLAAALALSRKLSQGLCDVLV